MFRAFGVTRQSVWDLYRKITKTVYIRIPSTLKKSFIYNISHGTCQDVLCIEELLINNNLKGYYICGSNSKELHVLHIRGLLRPTCTLK